jgi:hypothetical protein
VEHPQTEQPRAIKKPHKACRKRNHGVHWLPSSTATFSMPYNKGDGAIDKDCQCGRKEHKEGEEDF